MTSKFWQSDALAVFLVDDAGQLVGIISETDLMWQAGVDPPLYHVSGVIYLKNPAQYERDLHKALGQTVGKL